MTKAQIRKNAFLKSIPIMCRYISVSMAYGIMMENAGFGWYYSLFVSLTVYTGAFQPFYDPIMIIEKTEGRMAEDNFWIRIER